jgi:hypothetical protein
LFDRAMPFPTGTEFDRFQGAIEWLVAALGHPTNYPMLKRTVLPKLLESLAENFSTWVERGMGYLLPSLVLAVHRYQQHRRAPDGLITRLERGLDFYRGNGREVRDLTGNFWDPQMSSTLIMQLMVTASLLGRTAPGVLKPVRGFRPDLWIAPDGRDVGLEVTSRNALADLTLAEAGSVDWQRAEDDFNALWRGPIANKIGGYDGSFPVVLVVWDCHILGDVHSFITEPDPGGVLRSFCDLLAIHHPDCSPFSGIVYLPYIEPPQIALFDGMTRGQTLTPNEAAALRRAFDVNPAADTGFLPPEEIP